MSFCVGFYLLVPNSITLVHTGLSEDGEKCSALLYCVVDIIDDASAMRGKIRFVNHMPVFTAYRKSNPSGHTMCIIVSRQPDSVPPGKGVGGGGGGGAGEVVRARGRPTHPFLG